MPSCYMSIDLEWAREEIIAHELHPDVKQIGLDLVEEVTHLREEVNRLTEELHIAREQEAT